jgi:DnaJ-domain-containing protein 1
MNNQGYSTYYETKDTFDFERFFGMLIPILFVLLYFGYQRWKNRKWLKGTFPKDLTYTKTNLMEAYMCLTVYFITLDRFHQMQKIGRLKVFFSRHFKRIPEDFDEIIDRNFHYSIHPMSVAEWINTHANEQRKQQLIRFLVELAHIDGTLRPKEYDALKVLNQKFRLGILFLDSCISYANGTSNQRQQKSSSQSGENRKIKNERPRSVSLRKKYAEVLGVDENATETEIKKRYRQLVKLYHPDKFARESEEQQKQAHQRFLEIQKAYEYFVS